MVVETIDFYADEDAELPPPMSQRDVVALNNAAALDEEPPAADGAAEPGAGQARACMRRIARQAAGSHTTIFIDWLALPVVSAT